MAQTFEVAYVKQTGANLIIVFVTSYFRDLTFDQQCVLSEELQTAAKSAGMRGHVAFVWTEGHGKMGFWAPKQFDAFFSKLNTLVLAKSINRKLTIGA